MPEAPTPMYVGYLPLTPRHRRFLAIAVPLLFVALLVVPGVIAASQRDPGRAIWNTAEERTWTGYLTLDPYPMLVDQRGEGWLVVGMGKFGVRDQLEPFADRGVSLTGFELRRAHRRMIELSPGGSAISPAEVFMPVSEPAPPRNVTLITEIVDGKCFLGAMKPGDGKAHKACALLCIDGGLPPLLDVAVPMANGSDADALFPLLLVDGSVSLPPRIRALVAERVEVRGSLSFRHGVPVVRASQADIRAAR